MKFSLLSATTLLISALSAPALASPFQYGDLFVTTTSSGIFRYNQAGTLVQTISGGGIGLAFDPQGNLYTASGPTIQKYDNSGNALGTFASGFPSGGGATGISFDAAGNAYVAGIQDGTFDFINSYTSGGALIHSVSFVEGQENWVYIDAAANDTLFVTAGSTDVISKFQASTLAPAGGIFNVDGGPNGGVEGIAGGGFLVITGNAIEQFDAAGNHVFSYNTTIPTHGTWIGIDSLTATNFWAVTDFGEFYNFNLGTALPVGGGFQAPDSVRDIAVYSLPEPSTVLLVFGGMVAVALRKRIRSSY